MGVNKNIMSSNAKKIYRKYKSMPDEEWKETIRTSATDPMIEDIAFPLVPDEATQRHFVGATLSQVDVPFQYYKAIKDTYESRIGNIDERTKLLDVGSGWGRMIRFFMKDIAPSNLMGCDVDLKSINICDTCFRGELNFQLIKPLPPSPYEDYYFDIVEGYSVFSHLSYYAVVLWMHEYFRILKPGGMLAMTVWKQRRFDYIRKIQSGPPRSPETDRYHYMLQSSFSRDCELEEDLYKKAGVVYIPLLSSDPEITYGEAFISPGVLAYHWSSFFEHISTFELAGDQDIVFLRKRNGTPKIWDETLRETAKIAKMFDIQSICINSYNKKMRSGTSAELSPTEVWESYGKLCSVRAVDGFNVKDGTIERGGLGYILTADRAKAAVAMKKVDCSFKNILKIEGRMRSSLTSGIRNGFIAFTGVLGDENQQQARAGILMGRMMYTIEGGFVEKVEEHQEFDQGKTFDFEITINLKEKTVKLTVDGRHIASTMTKLPSSITHIGFVVSNSKTEFSSLQISGV